MALRPSKFATTHVAIDSDAFDPRILDPADYRDRVGIGIIRIRALPAKSSAREPT